MRVQYSKEQLKNGIVVSPAVTDELQAIIDDHLKKCGVFHRIFSRVKTPSSLAHKYTVKYYGEGEADEYIQDLIGLRINVYFKDDLKICQDILEACFELVSWTESDDDDKTFSATKINGVFRLPDYLVERISPETWDFWIDKTFEVQLKTIFFEGWHEVEHDMRYKNHEIWDSFPSTARHLNSILATLELCDISMESIFEDLAHDLYKNGDFENMIQMHFRLKFMETEIYDGLLEILGRDHSALAKKIFKSDRKKLIWAYFKQKKPIPININTAIALLNEEVLDKNPEINAILSQHEDLLREKNVGKTIFSNMDLQPLTEKPTFKADVVLRLSESAQDEDLFEIVSNCIYDWMHDKYQTIFADIPESLAEYGEGEIAYRTDGFEVLVTFDKTEKSLGLKASHIATNVIGRIYETGANLYYRGDKLLLEVRNAYKDYSHKSDYVKVMNFSYPAFYRQLCDDKRIDIVDIMPIQKKPQVITPENEDEILAMAKSPTRKLPIVCFIRQLAEGNNPKWLEDKWINSVSGFAWRYSHLFICDLAMARDMAMKLNAIHWITNADSAEEVFVVTTPKEAGVLAPHLYRYMWSEVEKCRYNWRLGFERDEKIHNILTGPDAFHHELINQLKLAILEER